MKRLDAISILTLAVSAGVLVITSDGTMGSRPADGAPPPLPPSAPIVVDADGEEAGALADMLGGGEVGVLSFGGDSASKH